MHKVPEGTIQVEVIADSISPYGIRITTLQLRYPRFIHAEFMTHRVFSRNARSSRAVPVRRLAAEEAYIPHFMQNQPGMQSYEEMLPDRLELAQRVWEATAGDCVTSAAHLAELGVHKQWANRMLEWFGFIDVVVTSTDWANFYALRDHEAAAPEIQALAKEMRAHMDLSAPMLLHHDDWHLPYVTNEDLLRRDLFECQLLSVARCARVSYAPFDGDGKVDVEADLKLAERLIGATPKHASPAEHQATPDRLFMHDDLFEPEWEMPNQHGNFFGWKQFRKTIVNEQVCDPERSMSQLKANFKDYSNAKNNDI